MKKYYPYLITVSHMINDSCQSVLPALLPLFIYTYGLSLEQAGVLILANTAVSSLLQPLLGYISDKINHCLLYTSCIESMWIYRPQIDR